RMGHVDAGDSRLAGVAVGLAVAAADRRVVLRANLRPALPNALGAPRTAGFPGLPHPASLHSHGMEASRRRGLLGCAAPGAPALAACTLGKIGELPVTMEGLKPAITVTVNGVPARMAVDSGA